MLSANFKPKRIAAASRGFLAIARLSCLIDSGCAASRGLMLAMACEFIVIFSFYRAMHVVKSAVLLSQVMPKSPSGDYQGR